MTELVRPEPTEIMNPATGEILSLAEARGVAIALSEIRDLEIQLRSAKAILSRRLAEEAERHGTQTLHLPGVTFSVSRKREIQWDLERLQELQVLGLPEDRMNDLIRTTVEYKVSASEAKRIAAANPAYAEVIEAARTDFLGEPYVGKIERIKKPERLES